MESEHYDVYAQFLLACKEVMGLDLLRIENDEEYRAEFFNNMAIDADDKIFALADLVNREIDDEGKKA